jgi:hypothetical protein
MAHRWNAKFQGKSEYSEKIYPFTSLSVTNRTWTHLWMKPVRRGEKPTNNSFFLFLVYSGEWDWLHFVRRPLFGLLYQPRMMDDECRAVGGKVTGKGKPKYSEKTCPSATLSTTNPAWPDPGCNPGRRGVKPATNRLSYGAAISCLSYVSYVTTAAQSLERS